MFRGRTATELARWLVSHNIDVEVYGKDTAKTVADLLEEQARSESQLDTCDGRALRTVRILSLAITNSSGQVLYEDEQILPDGRSRRRNVQVSEKLMGEEPWRSAVDRAIREELGTALPEGYQVTVDESSHQELIEFAPSMSYPGLLTKYVCHRVNATVSGLPDASFVTYEARPHGQLVSKWVWRDPDECEPRGPFKSGG